MTENTQSPLQQTATHILEFLLNGQRRTIPIVAIDAGNGIVMEETGEDTGWWKGFTTTGTKITIKFAQILKIEEYKVTSFNGQTSRTQTVNTQQLEGILDAATDRSTGEVKGNIRSIEQVGNPQNRVTKRNGEITS